MAATRSLRREGCHSARRITTENHRIVRRSRPNDPLRQPRVASALATRVGPHTGMACGSRRRNRTETTCPDFSSSVILWHRRSVSESALAFRSRAERREPVNPYAKFLAHRDPLAVATATPARIVSLIRGLAPRQLAKRPAPGKWSIQEIIGHLADTEMVMACRARWIAFENHPTLAPFDQEKWAAGSRAREGTDRRDVRAISAPAAVANPVVSPGLPAGIPSDRIPPGTGHRDVARATGDTRRTRPEPPGADTATGRTIHGETIAARCPGRAPPRWARHSMGAACSAQSYRGSWRFGMSNRPAGGAGDGNRKTCHRTIGDVADGAVSDVGDVADYGS